MGIWNYRHGLVLSPCNSQLQNTGDHTKNLSLFPTNTYKTGAKIIVISSNSLKKLNLSTK